MYQSNDDFCQKLEVSNLQKQTKSFSGGEPLIYSLGGGVVGLTSFQYDNVLFRSNVQRQKTSFLGGEADLPLWGGLINPLGG